MIAPVVANVRARAAALGRDPRSVKAFAVTTIVAAETDAEAQAKYAELLSYADYEGAMVQFAGPLGVDVSKFDPDQPLTDINPNAAHFTRHLFAGADPDRVWTLRDIADYMGVGGMGPKFVGSGKTIADEMQRWVDIADLDGFNITYAIRPGTFADTVQHVVPELRRRGLMREAYEGATFRENIYGAGQKRLRADHPGKKYWRG